MRSTTVHDVDVLVVGAGPTGLTAAGDLARAGRSVTVLERWPAENPTSRAFAVMPRTLEVLESRGAADELLALGQRGPDVTLFARARLDLTRLDTAYPFVLVTPQTNVEAALRRYAVAEGADIRRGTEVVALEQDADGVTVTARAKGDGDPTHRQTWRARYVIGADGAHSTVRTLLGADFPGKTLLTSLIIADVKLARGPSAGGLVVGTTGDVLGFLAPYNRHEEDGSWYRALVWDRDHQLPDDAPADDAEIIDILARAMGTDYGVTQIGWKSRFHCDERQVARYRHGRVFLAGDAAHVHSPMGGQGMNTGIQDAANLAWKLNAALGGADDGLLDTYHKERHPIGKRVLLQSGMIARGATLHRRSAMWLRNLLVPNLFRIPTVQDFVAGSFAGTALRYGRRGLVGTRAAAIPLVQAQLPQLQGGGGYVFIREYGAAPINAPGVQQAERADHGPAVLVRPDGYIAWAGASAGAAGAVTKIPQPRQFPRTRGEFV